MDHYYYTNHLARIWSEGVDKYKSGHQTPDGFLSQDDLNFLASIGLGIMDVFDYAEDFCDQGEPDFATFIAVHDIRRAYFLEVQLGQASETRLDVTTLPAKDESIEGIEWLPRILPKARAKLRGEMPPEIMYGCGGDRRFFKTNNIHPAELLRKVWEHGEADQPIIDWVVQRAEPQLQPI